MRVAMLMAVLAAAGCAGSGSDGASGTSGADGLRGQTGPQGPKGDKGDPGEPGRADGSKSGSRLQYLGKTLHGADGSVLVQGGAFWDSELEANCFAGQASDGKLRCIPGYAPNAAYFADDACTEPALDLRVTGNCEPTVPTIAYTMTRDAECAPLRTTYYRVGIETTEAFVKSGSNCVRADSAAYRYYRLGEVVPDSSLVEFTSD